MVHVSSAISIVLCTVHTFVMNMFCAVCLFGRNFNDGGGGSGDDDNNSF